MSRGLGSIQRKVLAVVAASTDGIATDTLAGRIFGRQPTPAQVESMRRAIRTLRARSMVEVTSRWEIRTRRSLKRFVDIAPCERGFCSLCAERKRRVRLDNWHRRTMRANAEHDPEWLRDLAIAEESGFVHATASAERVIDEKPNAVDKCQRRLQFVSLPPEVG